MKWLGKSCCCHFVSFLNHINKRITKIVLFLFNFQYMNAGLSGLNIEDNNET